MDKIRWWLRPDNPRLTYIVAGALLMGGVELGALSFIAEGPWVIMAVIGGIASVALVGGVFMIHWQCSREALQHAAREAMDHAEFEQMAHQVMIAMAKQFNDHCEAAGHGRPLVFDTIVYH